MTRTSRGRQSGESYTDSGPAFANPRRTAIALCIAALCSLARPILEPAQAAPCGSPKLEEVQRSFTLDGKPIPPELFRDMGDGDLADPGGIWIAADLQAAVASNLYAEEVKRDGRWVIQDKAGDQTAPGPERAGYDFIGQAANGIAVVLSSYSAGGSGTFYTLHTLDLASETAFDADGGIFCRIKMTSLRSIALGDRWSGQVSLEGTSMRITTTRQGPTDQSGASRTVTIEARRP